MSYDYFPTPPVRPSAPPAPPAVAALDRWGLPMTPPSDDERALLINGEMASLQAMGSPAYQPLGKRLGFFGSFAAGRQLTVTCWHVIVAEPWLLLVPVATLVVNAVVALTYVMALYGIDPGGTPGRLLYVPLFVALSAIDTVGGAVVVSAAADRLAGRDANLRRAWSQAVAHLPELVALGAVFAVQRMITSTLRNSRIGAFAANLIDAAWDFATYLAVPAVLFEDIGPLRAVRRSGQLVATRWGTQLGARGVIGVFIFFCALPALLLAMLVAATLSFVLGIVLFALAVLTLMSISAALSGVLSAAMYRFTTTGLLAGGFTEADLRLVLHRQA